MGLQSKVVDLNFDGHIMAPLHQSVRQIHQSPGNSGDVQTVIQKDDLGHGSISPVLALLAEVADKIPKEGDDAARTAVPEVDHLIAFIEVIGVDTAAGLFKTDAFNVPGVGRTLCPGRINLKDGFFTIETIHKLPLVEYQILTVRAGAILRRTDQTFFCGDKMSRAPDLKVFLGQADELTTAVINLPQVIIDPGIRRIKDGGQP